MEVLVPIDGSEPARKAVAHAAEARSDDNQIHLLHVIDPSATMYGKDAAYTYEAFVETRREAAERLFDEAVEIATDAGLEEANISRESVVGHPAREIVDYAEEHDVDRVVIGSHGRSGASRILLGSVAERVVRRAPVPVTVVR